MNKTERDCLVDTLIKFELAVAELYAAFGTVFPGDWARWNEFVEEERLHAQWLTKLKIYLKNEIISFQETKITALAVNHAIGFIKQQTSRARRNEIGLKQAILIALDIESSALESSFFKIFAFNTPNAEKIRRNLASATRDHRERFVLWLDRVERVDRIEQGERLVA